VASAFAEGGLGGFIILLFLRTVLLGLSHCTFTACTGIGFGVAVEAKSWPVKILSPVIGYGAAVMMHAMHNGLPTFFGGEGVVLMILISLVIDLLFFVILGLLVTRDRAIVIRELLGEVGGLLHPKELQLVSSYFELGMKNTGCSSRGVVALLRAPQEAARPRRPRLCQGAPAPRREGSALDQKENQLRHEIHGANRRGIWIGS